MDNLYIPIKERKNYTYEELKRIDHEITERYLEKLKSTKKKTPLVLSEYSEMVYCV